MSYEFNRLENVLTDVVAALQEYDPSTRETLSKDNQQISFLSQKNNGEERWRKYRLYERKREGKIIVSIDALDLPRLAR